MIQHFIKIFRYISMFGVKRTFEKVISFLHSRKKLPNFKFHNTNKIFDDGMIAIIGCGNFAFSTIAFFLSKKNKFFLSKVYDIDNKKAESLSNYFGGVVESDLDNIYKDKNIKLAFISSNHATHAEYAIKFIYNKINVHIEKPHVVNFDQLTLLNQAMKKNPSTKVFVGFNRPHSNLTLRLLEEIEAEKGYLISNFYIIGHKLDENHWYYNPKEGSRVVSNVCHWSDLLLFFMRKDNIFPIKIIPSSPKNESNFSISIIFNNESFSNLMFSSNSDTIEGVREVINIQKGDIYAKIIDYKYLEIDKKGNKKKLQNKIKNQGHEEAIINSYECVRLNKKNKNYRSRKEIILSAYFFLKLDESLKNNNIIDISETEFFNFYNS